MKSKTWTSEIVINKSITKGFKFFDGSEKNIKIMDPNIVSHEIIKETKEKIGTVARQTYREHGKDMTYDVITTDYSNGRNEKCVEITFEMMNMFDITARHDLIKIDANSFKLKYTATNKPLKFVAKLMMLIPGTGSTKMVDNHVKHIKDIIENDKF